MAKRILYVDDDPDYVDWLCTTLKKAGYDCLLVADPAQARSILNGAVQAGQPLGGLVADLRMNDPASPTPNVKNLEVGVAFLQWVRDQVAFKDLPIIVVTALSTDERLPGIKYLLRIKSILQKPVPAKAFSDAVLSAFGPP